MATEAHSKSMARLEACKHQTLKLNLEDSEAFADALLNPPKINGALKSAAFRYKQVMSIE